MITLSDPIQDAWWDGVTDIAYTSTTNLQSDYGSQVSAHVRSIYGTTTHVAGMGTGLPAAYELHPVAHGILVALAPNSDGNLRLWVFQNERWVQTAGGDRMFDESLQKIKIINVAPHILHIFVPAIGGFGHVWAVDLPSLEVQLCLTYVTQLENQVQWQNIDAVSGVFLANRLVFDDVDIWGPVTLNSNADPDVVGASKGIQTVQSFDFGAVWTGLESPRCPRSAGKCHQNVQLHLHSWVTCAAAAGIVVAVGREIPHRAFDTASDAIFISRDAGLVWTRVLEGHWKVILVGRGDIIVAIGANVQYSFDYGRHWKILPLAKTRPYYRRSAKDCRS